MATLADILSHPINTIVNKSMTEATIPNQLKISKTIPIFKSGLHDNFNNYRPISLLPNRKNS